ncbi:MAG TPA: hypothetical protein VKB69_14185 [Micromonosporaceae bacterium]|nr:hypothetical protein [Micromonosporaceae bacterium]
MATTNAWNILRRTSTLGPVARRLSFVAVGAVALVGVGAGTAASAADAPTTGKAYTAATRTVGGVPLKVAVPVTEGTASAASSATSTTVVPVKPAAPKPAAKPAAPAKKAPAKPAAKKPAAPSRAQLMPHGVPGGQVSFKTNQAQLRNAATIVKVGQQMHLPPRAWVMAVACSLQESKLTNLGNLGNLNDHDSLGLFQQRPSSGWGSPKQITTPSYAAHKFYAALKSVPGYQHMPLTRAIQKVQVSAFPQAYAKWEKMAAALVTGTYK